jgi:hypothetical protein
MESIMSLKHLFNAAALTLLTAASASAQTPGAAPQQPQPAINTTPGPYLQNFGGVSTSFEPGKHRSDNIKLMAHVPLGTVLTISDIDVEQELTRPYAYVTRRLNPSGWDIISLKNINDANALKKAEVICRWRIENAELHQGAGGLNPMYFKHKGRYYLTEAFQFQQGGPDADLGAIVWDVTGLPNCAAIKEVGRIREPELLGGFHESFTYKHSNGTPLLVTTTTGPNAHVYDMDKFIRGEPALVGKIPVPEGAIASSFSRNGYHDFYLGYDTQTKQDKFYGAGAGGFYVYDITDVANPKLVTAATGISGITRGHTFTPDPLGRFAMVETEYQYAPLRMLDLKPNNGQSVPQINRTIGAWTANWKNLAHNMEVRWPYVFVSAYEDGMYVTNIMDPTNPITVGFYDTYDGPHNGSSTGVMMGAWGVDVRNADGLVVVSDLQTGFWAFKMEGFDGWNGHDWGMPNISSAQDWDKGPEGAPQPARPVTMLDR